MGKACLRCGSALAPRARSQYCHGCAEERRRERWVAYSRARRGGERHRPRRPPPSVPSPSPETPAPLVRALEDPPSPPDVPPPDLTGAVPAPEPPPHLDPREGPAPETLPGEDYPGPPPDLEGVRERLAELESPLANLLRGLFPEAYRGETEEISELSWVLANWNDPTIPAGERWTHLRRARFLCAANGAFERPVRDLPPAPLDRFETGSPPDPPSRFTFRHLVSRRRARIRSQ